MFGSFLPSLLVGFSTTNFTREWEPTLSWNQFLSLVTGEAKQLAQSSNPGRRIRKMHHVRQEELPFVGSSHEFVGAAQGNTSVSVFLFHGKPGSGPGPHRHPYDEVQFIREGRGVWTVSGKTFEGSAGDIFVIKAGEVHSFRAVGDSPLIQLDVHLSPRFIQENL
jgi:quercetin dioxygenase-like cupin family protein